MEAQLYQELLRLQREREQQLQQQLRRQEQERIQQQLVQLLQQYYDSQQQPTRNQTTPETASVAATIEHPSRTVAPPSTDTPFSTTTSTTNNHVTTTSPPTDLDTPYSPPTAQLLTTTTEATLLERINNNKRNKKLTKYHDYSHVMPPLGYRPPTDLSRMCFAEKLHVILTQTDLKSIVEWRPHGRAFQIYVPQLFAMHVCPTYFGHSSFARFRKDLKEHGFTHIHSGLDEGCKSWSVLVMAKMTFHHTYLVYCFFLILDFY